jgi:hypothetical protein
MKPRIIDPRKAMTPYGHAVERAGSLGQLDKEFDYGPQPLHSRDVPIDLRERLIRHNRAGIGGGEAGGAGGGFPDLSQLINDVHSIAGVFVLRRGLIGRVVTITSVPQLIIQQQEIGGRGYLLLNPAGVVGLTAVGTLFPSTTLVGATTSTSGSVGVANFKTARFFIKATFGAGVGPVTFDLQSLDPASSTYVTTQTLASLIATGNQYIDVGTNGIDTDFQVLVTVPVATTVTFTMGYVLKDGLEGTSAGVSQTIFFGGSGVSPNSGYPLLAGKERPFYFMENVSLYGVTAGPNLDMNIFEF